MGELYEHKWRTVKYKHSFFPSAIADWNKLSVDLVPNDSLSKFKKYLNNKFFIDNRLFDYNMISGAGSKILTQIRLGLSPLGEHLHTYTILVITPSAKIACPLWNQQLIFYFTVENMIKKGLL